MHSVFPTIHVTLHSTLDRHAMGLCLFRMYRYNCQPRPTNTLPTSKCSTRCERAVLSQLRSHHVGEMVQADRRVCCQIAQDMVLLQTILVSKSGTSHSRRRSRYEYRRCSFTVHTQKAQPECRSFPVAKNTMNSTTKPTMLQRECLSLLDDFRHTSYDTTIARPRLHNHQWINNQSNIGDREIALAETHV